MERRPGHVLRESELLRNAVWFRRRVVVQRLPLLLAVYSLQQWTCMRTTETSLPRTEWMHLQGYHRAAGFGGGRSSHDVGHRSRWVYLSPKLLRS